MQTQNKRCKVTPKRRFFSDVWLDSRDTWQRQRDIPEGQREKQLIARVTMMGTKDRQTDKGMPLMINQTKPEIIIHPGEGWSQTDQGGSMRRGQKQKTHNSNTNTS